MESSQKLDYEIICSSKCKIYLDVEIKGLSFANFLVVYDKNIDLLKENKLVDPEVVFGVDK